MINLEISDSMSAKSGIENRIIRMSGELRNELNIKLGEFIIIQGLALQVDQVYKEDLLVSTKKAFVSKNTFAKFNKNSVDFTVTKHITLGCDPEFFLVDSTNNCLYNPSALFKKQDPIGHDGMLVELRPQPSLYHEEVIKNLSNMINHVDLQLKIKQLTKLRMIARSSGWGAFAGFHVHMGIPPKLLFPNTSSFGKILKIIVKALDYYVGTLAVLTEPNDSARRCSPFVNYGKVSDFRISARTLEYRVPGGALLRHPGLSTGLLGMCSLVSHDIIERLRKYTDDFVKPIVEDEDTLLKTIYPNILKSQDMFGIICIPTTNKAEEESAKILDDFTYMVNYKQYKSTIENFMHLTTKNISDDMLFNWDKNMEQVTNV